MADLKTIEKNIEDKLRLLKFNAEETSTIFQSSDLKAIERQASVLESTIDKLHELKLQVHEIKIESNVDHNEVRIWTEELVTKVREFEEVANRVKAAASRIRCEEAEKPQEINRKQVLGDEIELEKAKFEVKMKFEEAAKSSRGSSAGAKLPKLVITKFQGKRLDWTRFWNQYETEIDKSNITQVAKLSYLRKLLVPSAKVLIEGLPFTSEGYERAKAILNTKYGQVSKGVNTHIQCILELPKVQGTDPSRGGVRAIPACNAAESGILHIIDFLRQFAHSSANCRCSNNTCRK